MNGKILANLLLQAIWMVKLRHLKGKNLANCHEFAKYGNSPNSPIFPAYSSLPDSNYQDSYHIVVWHSRLFVKTKDLVCIVLFTCATVFHLF